MQRASSLLKKQQDPNCQVVSISRKGSVIAYENEFPSALVTSSDFSRFKADACIKVVELITWCGDDMVLPTGGALGCAPLSGEGFVVVREYPTADNTFNKGVEPVTWLHEFGHTRGMLHNISDYLSVMAPGLTPDNSSISPTECATYRGISRDLTAAIAQDIQPGKPYALPAQARKQSQVQLPVEQFVKQIITGSYPVEQAKTYSGEVKKIESMLLNPEFASHRNNIIALLGVVGTPETIPILEKVIETPVVGKPTQADIYARLAAPLAIGAIANRYKLPEVDYKVLRQASNPSYWAERLAPATQEVTHQSTSTTPLLPANGVQSNTERLDKKDVTSLSRALSTQSYKGYAITGSSSVTSVLKQDRVNNANAAIPAHKQKEREGIIKEAITLNELSKKSGALATYD
jgi:hypothetical protein